ncbi:MAG: glycosyltransferase [Pseudonocardiaceae bacterium]
MTELGIVIPARNEAGYIGATLDTLFAQIELDGCTSVPAESYEVVVVENASTDATTDVVLAKKHEAGRAVTVLHRGEASAVAARAAGVRHLLSSADPPRFLVSADADTRYPRTWLAWLTSHLRLGAELVTCPGYMDAELWRQCPRATAAYIERIGTIFFDPETRQHLGTDENRALLSEQVYLDFGRPANAAGFAITTECYERLGGFRREHFDEAGTEEILIAALPLQFRAELAGLRVVQPRGPWWSTSPRRLVGEPDVQFGRTFQRNEMEQYRSTALAAYERFDAIVSTSDLRDLQLNCVRDYIVTPCITRPGLVEPHRDTYFGAAAADLETSIVKWRSAHPDPEPREIFDVATRLAERHADQTLEVLARRAGLTQ